MSVPALPNVDDPELGAFWEGCRLEELRIPRCDDCGRYVWYPRSRCPGCGRSRIGWRRVSGRGRLFTWVEVHRAFLPAFADRIPYLTALVEFEEDPAVRMATLLDHRPAASLRPGLPVEVFFERVSDRVTLPRFRIRAGSGGAT
ncbi:MAG: Zn-ribbon domain-containing OB-fold protein [Candidatus Binatia bacterium]